MAPVPQYRKDAFAYYKDHRCVWCGFAIKELLQVAHLNMKRSECAVENLALLCPTCHCMHDLDLLEETEVAKRRDRLHRKALPEGAKQKAPSVWCAWCGFGLEDGMARPVVVAGVGDVLHLCPTCRARTGDAAHQITPEDLVLRYANRARPVRHKKRMKDAAEKAGKTRSRQAAARRAVRTRLANMARGTES